MCLTVERVRQVISYDPETGICWWLITAGKARKGAIAGSLRNNDGYIGIGIDGVGYLAHRLIYFWMTGEWPAAEIDHHDLNRQNNKWDNLRPATSLQNKANSPVYKNNKCGVKGVHWHAKSRKWRAMIRREYKSIHLGLFETVAEAHRAYRTAADAGFGSFSRSA